jgi:hypothetical protein
VVSGTAGVITVLGFPLLLMTTLIGMHHFERWSGRRPPATHPHPVPHPLPHRFPHRWRRPTTAPPIPYPDNATPEPTLADQP